MSVGEICAAIPGCVGVLEVDCGSYNISVFSMANGSSIASGDLSKCHEHTFKPTATNTSANNTSTSNDDGWFDTDVAKISGKVIGAIIATAILIYGIERFKAKRIVEANPEDIKPTAPTLPPLPLFTLPTFPPLPPSPTGSVGHAAVVDFNNPEF